MAFLLLLGGLEGFDELGDDFEQIAGDTVVRHLEDRNGLVLVHGDDALGILHTSHILDSTGGTQSHIYLEMDGLASIADLMVSGDSIDVHAGAGGTHDTTQNLGRLDTALDVFGKVYGNYALTPSKGKGPYSVSVTPVILSPSIVAFIFPVQLPTGSMISP